MTDDQLLRYSRHVLLNEVGIEVQNQWMQSHALVIGAGGLGSPVILYLAAAGVGQLTVVDHDDVDLTNLQRQIAHDASRVGLAKARSAEASAHALNPEVKFTPVVAKADAALLASLVPTADIVIDCCDNFATRQLINAACVQHHKPLVSGSALRFDGQVSVFDSRDASSPCYACVFPPDSNPEETACATMGVFAPLVGIIGTVQAAEALKVLGSIGTPLTGRLLMLDSLRLEWTEMRISRDPACQVCGHMAQLAV